YRVPCPPLPATAAGRMPLRLPRQTRSRRIAWRSHVRTWSVAVLRAGKPSASIHHGLRHTDATCRNPHRRNAHGQDRLVFRKNPLDPMLHDAVAVNADRERFASDQRGKCAPARAPRSQRPYTRPGTQGLDRRQVSPVGRVVHEGAQINAVTLREPPEYAIGADLVALVGRPWEPVAKKQYRFHG